MLAPLRVSLVLLVLCGGIYPAAVTLVGCLCLLGGDREG